MNERHRGILEMVAAMGISGTIGWVVLHSNLPVISLVFWRCLFGAFALLIVCAALGVFRGNLTRRVITFAALGGVAIVANWLLLFAAFPLASISIATAVYSTQPFILVGLGAAFLSEKITATKLLWLGLCFGGALLIVQARPSADYVGAGYLVGIAMAFGAAFCYALASIFAKKLQGTPPHLIALIQVCVGVFDARTVRACLSCSCQCERMGESDGAWSYLHWIGLYSAVRRHPEASDLVNRIALLRLSDRLNRGRRPRL
jgi:drug/metabolite transporter (DMT)-like permease